MIKTTRADFLKDLGEVLYMFSSGEGLEIEHIQSKNGDVYLDQININGKKYQYKNEFNSTETLEIKRMEKRFSKLALYRSLCDYYGVNLTWGALTGVRPIKMARDIGSDFERVFREVFDVSNKKIALVKEVLSTQDKLADLNGEYSGVFIGVPFCPSRCKYCSFISEVISKSRYVAEYVQALVKEINSFNFNKVKVRSVYVGGGTPVCLPNKEFAEILSAIKSKICDGIEFTVEAGRPDEITKEKLEIMKQNGVTRVCVNPQTFNDKTLKVIGRNHTAKDVIDKFFLVKSYGFKVNTDLIAGLSGESFEDFKYSLDTAISLNPENVTVHTLCVKRGSTLKTETDRLCVSDVEKMIDYSNAELKKAGYNPYYLYRQKFAAENLENVGYAKEGEECIYNIDVMEEFSNNPAFGADAVSKRVLTKEKLIKRYGAPKDVLTYVNKVDEIIREKNQLFDKDA